MGRQVGSQLNDVIQAADRASRSRLSPGKQILGLLQAAKAEGT